MYQYFISTEYVDEMINIDDLLIDAIKKAGLEEGIAYIFTPHTTAGITINENGDPDVQRDMIYGLNQLLPPLAEYRHFEGNTTAHIKSSLIGCSEIVLIEKARPVFGTWQSLYFMEFDGPRKRKIYISLKE